MNTINFIMLFLTGIMLIAVGSIECDNTKDTILKTIAGTLVFIFLLILSFVIIPYNEINKSNTIKKIINDYQNGYIKYKINEERDMNNNIINRDTLFFYEKNK